MNDLHHSNAPRRAASDGLEPIAIIGMGCRFPGDVHDPESYWALLQQGRDAITEIPADRWSLKKFYDARPGKPGKSQTCWGGFLGDLVHFDPQFFGISPREAARMDPQQRWALEVAWEAIEDAGQTSQRMAGSNTAVYLGISSWEHAFQVISHRDRGVLDGYTNTGGALSIAANRISYCFDLRGPSVAVDTACSSALVAVHHACQSIWHEQCEMALAGGVNALLIPEHYISFSQLSMLSPDGRCKAFDARANGFVRSEGAGMVLLKPLSQAQADGDRIYAVIRATAMNQDGRTPGMTVPSKEAQESLIRKACRMAHIDPTAIDYVEAHGTGTPVGDPIEASALGAVLGRGRALDQSLAVGSVKTNIGHLEAGSGAASVIKVALMLQRERIPGNLHFDEPNPNIDFDRLRLRVPRQAELWRRGSRPRRAGVNSFGYGGANAHVILEEAPLSATALPAPEAAATHPRAELIPLAARSREALHDLSAVWRDWLRSDSTQDWREVAANAAMRRSRHECRISMVAGSREELLEQVTELAEQGTLHGAAPVRAPAEGALRVGFVCCGQGPQWWAMGRQLLREEPVFRGVLERCDAIVRKLGPWSLLEELTVDDESRSKMQITAISQPCIFAVQAALAALWENWGVRPVAVTGHSVGEVAAAYLAGVFSLQDAVRVIYQRGRCMELATDRGGMLAVGLSAADAEPWMAPFAGQVELAAVNAPRSLTLSGNPDCLDEMHAALEERGVYSRRLHVAYAFHSAQMDPVRDELLRSLPALHPGAARIPLFSTVTGEQITGGELTAEYWWRNVRQPVRFADAIAQMAPQCDVLIELGPHPVLAAAISETCDRLGQRPLVLPSLRRRDDERATMLRSAGALHDAGYPMHERSLFRQPTQFLSLPRHPWRKEVCWFESDVSRRTRLQSPIHPLLGCQQSTPDPAWENRLDVRLQPYLADHRVQRSIVVPAAAYLEMSLAAAAAMLGGASWEVSELKFINPCVLTEDASQWVETRYAPEDGSVRIHCQSHGSDEWTLLSTSCIRSLEGEPAPALCPPEPSQWETLPVVDAASTYAFCKSLGLDYGPTFRGVSQVRTGEMWASATVDLPPEISDRQTYVMHPALLDACFHTGVAALPSFCSTADDLFLPIDIQSVRLYRPPQQQVQCVARLTHMSANWRRAEFDIFNPDGQLVMSVRGMRSQRVSADRRHNSLESLLYAYRWEADPGDASSLSEASAGEAPPRGPWLIFADRKGVGEALAQRLRDQGQPCHVVGQGRELMVDRRGNSWTMEPASRPQMMQLLQTLLARDGSPPCGIVHLWNLDAPAADQLHPARLEAAQDAGVMSVLHLVQAWDSIVGDHTAGLLLTTRGAQSVGDLPEQAAIAQSPAIGLGRVIISESPRLPCRLVDLDPGDAAPSVESLWRELHNNDLEDEVAWRNGQRFVHRYVAYEETAPTLEARLHHRPYRLAMRSAGSLENMALATAVRHAPDADDVEIEVAAAALNFSDVMKGLGLYPGLARGEIPLGAECSGVVTRVGRNVANVKIGEAVLAVAPQSFGSHVVTPAALTARKPEQLSFAAAAALPIAFLTAEYALHELARLQEGESLLIHSASGGVGLAALQLAQRAGAEVFATAGSAQKRAFLQDQGVQYVMDSRSLAFADQVLEYTDGRGVDVILNSLPGKAIQRGLDCLAEYGRFLEIGKRDIYNNTRLGLRPFRNNLSFFAIDLDRVIRQRPELLGRLLQRLMSDFGEGALRTLPMQTYGIEDFLAAFRLMQQGKHIGKIVLSMREQPPRRVAPGEFEPLTFGAESTYLITGGFGGFGASLARWIVQKGARNLALLSRSGADTPEAQALLAELEAAGARVCVLRADVADQDQVAAALQDISSRQFPPLRGVFHAAMVLEDGLLANLDRDWMRRVMAPKVQGGWNLHQATADLPLDHFVLFSSLSSAFGHAGQGNYAAANAFLDQLAHFRRARGLPCLTINWGYLGDVGYLSHRKSLGERLERQGVKSFSIAEALGCLELIMQREAVQVSVMRIDWTKWKGLGVTDKVSPRFAHLLPLTAAGLGSEMGGSLREQLRAANHQQRQALVESMLRTKLGRVLGVEPEKLDGEAPLLDLGLDSLMAVEMRNWIETELQIVLPIVELMRSPRLTRLTQLVVQELDLAPAVEAPSQPASQRPPLESARQAADYLARLDQLSSDEVDNLLAELMTQQKNSDVDSPRP